MEGHKGSLRRGSCSGNDVNIVLMCEILKKVLNKINRKVNATHKNRFKIIHCVANGSFRGR